MFFLYNVATVRVSYDILKHEWDTCIFYMVTIFVNLHRKSSEMVSTCLVICTFKVNHNSELKSIPLEKIFSTRILIEGAFGKLAFQGTASDSCVKFFVKIVEWKNRKKAQHSFPKQGVREGGKGHMSLFQKMTGTWRYRRIQSIFILFNSDEKWP